MVCGAYYEIFAKHPELEKGEAKDELKYYAQFPCFCASTALTRFPTLGELDKFVGLLEEWRKERKVISSVTDMAMSPAYQKIIGMGPIAISLILAQLQSEGDEPDHWFWALRVLTDTDPVKEEDRGDIVKMAKTWLVWGRNQGYV